MQSPKWPVMKAQVFTLFFAIIGILTGCQGTKSKGTAAVVKVERGKPPVSVARSSEKKNAKPSQTTIVPETRVEKTTERTVETTTVLAGDEEIKGGQRN